MRTQHILMALFTVTLAAQAQAFAQTPPATPPAAAAPAAPQTVAPAASAAPTAPSVASAPATTPAAAPAATEANTGTASTTSVKKLYCPEISKLIKKEMFWGAPGGWRSYSESFVNTIASFGGAQWIGINLGKMVCVYKGKETFEFPVVLQNDTLTPTPEGDKWVKPTPKPGESSGYMNCLSGDILDCPFKFQEEKTDMKDVYKDLDFFKGKGDYLKNDGTTPPPK
jgi:hypothetical protein